METVPTEMVDLDRERLLEAALTQLGERGRGAMSVSGLAAAADASVEEFSTAYPDLDSCLADAYELLTRRLFAAIQAGCAADDELPTASERSWAARVRRGLEALLGGLVDDLGAARTLTITYPSLGPVEQARYQGFVEAIAALMREQWKADGGAGDLPDEVEMLAVGAAEAIVVEEIRAGRGGELRRMAPEILFSVLVPYLGAAAATEEMERARLDR
ncbi:MAG TPA: hypothetical protein VMF55_12580 [Solirubrobacterales bacterium]|nr:hypothetical protein [Solirubrobacterales bacterium]